MISFWVMTLVVFHMVRRRSNATLALAAALLPCYTAAYRYSYEARGYGLMLGLFALSLKRKRGDRSGLAFVHKASLAETNQAQPLATG